MHTFKDNAGRVWSIEINIGLAKMVRARTGIDFYKLLADGFEKLAELLADPITLIDCVWLLVEDQAKKLGVTDEQFGQALAGDALMNLADAFVEAFIDFFPNPQARTTLRKITAKGKIYREKMLTLAEMKIDALELPEPRSREQSGNSQDSQELIPTSSVSAS